MSTQESPLNNEESDEETHDPAPTSPKPGPSEPQAKRKTPPNVSSTQVLKKKKEVSSEPSPAHELVNYFREQREAKLKEKTTPKVKSTPTELFFQSLAQTVDCFPDPIKAEIKLKVANIVFQQEIKLQQEKE